MGNMVRGDMSKTAFILACLLSLAVGPTYGADQPARQAKQPSTSSEAKIEPGGWGKVVEAAKKEGKVVIYSALANRPRQAVSKAFKGKFGIDLEWLSGQGSAQVTKVETERRAGIYIGDVMMAGVTSQSLFKKNGFLESMDNVLILPEVKDPKQWMDGKLPFVDNEHMMISYFIHAGSSVVINTELVKEEEIKSYLDLLAPKWKKKIVMQDPTVSGAGNVFFTINILEIMGKDFGYKLARQEPLITRDKRLSLEWVGRGKYPLILAPDTSFLGELTKAGAPLKHIVPREGTYSGGGSGGLAMLNKVAHPNAAAVFINWILSKEGQTIMAEAQPDQSVRLDVSTEFIDADRRIYPNVKYINSDAEKYLKGRLDMINLAKEMFGL